MFLRQIYPVWISLKAYILLTLSSPATLAIISSLIWSGLQKDWSIAAIFPRQISICFFLTIWKLAQAIIVEQRRFLLLQATELFFIGFLKSWAIRTTVTKILKLAFWVQTYRDNLISPKSISKILKDSPWKIPVQPLLKIYVPVGQYF